MLVGSQRRTFDEQGAIRWPGAATDFVDCLSSALEPHAHLAPGVRLRHTIGLSEILALPGGIIAQASRLAGQVVKPVRALLLDKTANANWALGWHQDRTITVRERVDVPGFGPWSTKAGQPHVEPPFAIIASMLTLRIHLDPVPAANAPLLIATGSHLRGRIAEPDIARVVAESEIVACIADRGDVWAYATSIVHASAAAVTPTRRRVLQIDFSAAPLPAPLEWAGI